MKGKKICLSGERQRARLGGTAKKARRDRFLKTSLKDDEKIPVQKYRLGRRERKDVMEAWGGRCGEGREGRG